MITFKHNGNFKKTEKFLRHMSKADIMSVLKKHGQKGVAALSAATPVESGLTASSWYYDVEIKNGSASITFNNSNIQNGVPIAVILQYGHGTRNGGWVQGRDYINPAIQPIFDVIATNAWREVAKL